MHGSYEQSYSRCYSFSDYDENGKLKAGAKEYKIPMTPEFLDRRVSMNVYAYAEMKRYIFQWKARCDDKPSFRSEALDESPEWYERDGD